MTITIDCGWVDRYGRDVISCNEDRDLLFVNTVPVRNTPTNEVYVNVIRY